MGNTRLRLLGGTPAALALSAVLLLGGGPQPATGQEGGLVGSAFGFFTSVGLFGGPATDIGPVPLVTLPPEGSAEPITTTDPTGESAQFGPAVILEPSAMTVSTQGEGGSVSSSASITFSENRDEQVDPLYADELTSECTGTLSDRSGTVTLGNGSLVLRTDENTGESTETIDLPAQPEPNTTFGGTVDHLGDTFRAVFNEQIDEGGILTVNAVHIFFGQNAEGEETDGVSSGEAVIGQVVCGTGSTDGTPSDPETGADGNGTTTTGLGQAAAPASGDDETGGGTGGTALLIGALAVGGGVIAAVAIRSRRAEPPAEE